MLSYFWDSPLNKAASAACKCSHGWQDLWEICVMAAFLTQTYVTLYTYRTSRTEPMLQMSTEDSAYPECWWATGRDLPSWGAGWLRADWPAIGDTAACLSGQGHSDVWGSGSCTWFPTDDLWKQRADRCRTGFLMGAIRIQHAINTSNSITRSIVLTMISCLHCWVLPDYICGDDKRNFIILICLLFF